MPENDSSQYTRMDLHFGGIPSSKFANEYICFCMEMQNKRFWILVTKVVSVIYDI